jgi:hypothetical protein
MSETLDTSRANLGFASFPSLHYENTKTSRYAEMDTPDLESRVNEYTNFLSGNCMPRARAIGERIVNHILFELAYRDGVYDGTPEE